jgi:TolB-like protein/Tfp pilus assembly protein PilF
MPSLLPGYEYDIFISYRQNDNRPSAGSGGWVTEFVKALQEELASTIKDPVSIYYDSNPHDGLLETHQVDQSLANKLKCLIFIPILSQTYCDPKSFAWQQEFCAFNKLANGDALGRDITLQNGNVSSRILPVRIHDLDQEDRTTIEKELGGNLRAVDFIYKEAGVNRPLKPTDQKNDNLNKTDYRNQLNKVANAIKDMLTALRNPSGKTASSTDNTVPPIGTIPNYYRKGYFIALLSVALAATIYLTYRFAVSGSAPASKNPSIAVLPFVDLTPERNMEYLGDGIAEEIINSLTTIKELKVAGRTSSFQFKGEKVDLRTVGETLEVGFVLEGSIQKYEDNFRITAQLIRTGDNFHAWSQRFDLKEVNIFKIQDAIADAIVEKLRITLTTSEKNQLTKKEINPEAYTEYLKGLHHWKANEGDLAAPHFSKAIQLDSTYAQAYAYMGLCKSQAISRSGLQPHPDSVDNALYYAMKAKELDPALPDGYSVAARISWMHQRDFAKAKIYFEKSIKLNPSTSLNLNRYAYFLKWMGDFAKASELNREAILLDPIDWNSYTLLFDSAYYNNDARAASRILAEYRRLFGTDRRWINMRVDLYYMQKEYSKVIHYFDSLQATGVVLEAEQISVMARSFAKLGNGGKADSLLNLMVTRIRNSGVTGMDGFQNGCFAAAMVYAVKGDADSCFFYLNLAADRFEGSTHTLKIVPDLEPLRPDPRYVKLYKSMGFDKYH